MFQVQVPIYGSVGTSQHAMNDQPLEFGSVIEAAPQTGDTSAVIAAPPQTHGQTFSGESYVQGQPLTHEAEYYNPTATGRHCEPCFCNRCMVFLASAP